MDNIRGWLGGETPRSTPAAPQTLSPVTVVEALSNPEISSKDALAVIREGIGRRKDAPEIFSALGTQIATQTLAAGGTLEDRITDPQNPHALDINWLRETVAGVTVTPAYTDDNREIRILLSRKKGETEFRLAGGYFRPRPLNAEAAPGSYDINLEACARRELWEETKLDPSTSIPFYALDTRSQHGFTNDPRLHTVVQDFMVNYGRRNEPPPAFGGSDLDGSELVWVSAKNIENRAPAGEPQPYGSPSRFQVTINGETFPLRDDHGVAIEKAVGLVRQQELETLFAGQPPLAVTGETPQSSVGKAAHDYHQVQRTIATTRRGHDGSAQQAFTDRVSAKESSAAAQPSQSTQETIKQILANGESKIAPQPAPESFVQQTQSGAETSTAMTR